MTQTELTEINAATPARVATASSVAITNGRRLSAAVVSPSPSLTTTLGNPAPHPASRMQAKIMKIRNFPRCLIST